MDPLRSLLSESLARLNATPQARAYVIGVLAQPTDLSGVPLTVEYAEATLSRDFARVQAIGDWVLWYDVISPQRDYVRSLGRMSYYQCYRFVPTWRVYEELADTLPYLSACARHLLVDTLR